MQEKLIRRVEVARQTGVLYFIWCLFAPIPLGCLAFACNAGTFTNSVIVRLPGYLSIKSRLVAWTLTLATYLCFFSWMGLCVTSVILGFPDQWDIKVSDANKDVLICWLFLCHVILFARAICRLVFHADVNVRLGHIMPPSEVAKVEYYFDVAVWSSIMIGFVGLMSGLSLLILYPEDAPHTNTTSYSKGAYQLHDTKVTDVIHPEIPHIHWIRILVWFFLDSWIFDIVLRFLWFPGASFLIQDFESTTAARFVAELPIKITNDTCAICLSENAFEGCAMPCGHTFHKECLVSWVRANELGDDFSIGCPMCRAKFDLRPNMPCTPTGRQISPSGRQISGSSA